MSRRPDWTDIKEGDDVYALLKGVYEHGRALPYGKNPHDYRQPERTSHRRAPTLGHEPASYEPVKDTKVSRPYDESEPQFRDSKMSHYNDCHKSWVTGYGDAPHFDSGPSGHRYRK